MKLLSALVLALSCIHVSGAISALLTTNLIHIGNVSQLDIAGPITMMTWIKTANALPGRLIIDGFHPSTFVGYGFGVGYASGGKPSYYSSIQGAWVGANTAITNGIWHHIAVSVSGTTATFYLDGAADGTPATKPSTNNTSPKLLLNDFGNVGINSTVMGIGIFNRALSANEISIIANSRSALVPLNFYPVGYWLLNDLPEGTSGDLKIFIDMSGYNGHGIGTNGPGGSLVSVANPILTFP